MIDRRRAQKVLRMLDERRQEDMKARHSKTNSMQDNNLARIMCTYVRAQMKAEQEKKETRLEEYGPAKSELSESAAMVERRCTRDAPRHRLRR